MVKLKIISELDKVLKKNEQKYYLDGILNKSRVIEDLHNYDPDLIGLLTENEAVKKHFILDINGNKVVKINELIEIFEMNEYWNDSYTAYENKIGLNSNGIFLSDDTDVVLDFPYKDTVLKASMSKEEREKEDLLPEEPFLNEIIAREEIDTLFDNKVLVNATKYDEEGSHEVTKFSKEDNLILKGNNLLALHSLKDKYAGKIKLIYIDPPYNTGSDSFQYNDNFTHSTWLTFIKNRLEIAKELLSNEGIIVVQVDYHENSYLRVLMDEIYGSNNFVSEISVQMSTPSGPKMAHIKKRIPKLKDSLLIFKKDEITINKQPYKMKDKWDSEYSKILLNFSEKDKEQLALFLENNDYDSAKNIIEQVELSTISKSYPEFKNNKKWLNENAWRIVADKQNTGLDKKLSDSKRFWSGDVSLAKTNKGNLTFFRTDKEFGKDTRVEIVFADENLKEHTGDLWTDITTSGGFSYEGGINFPTAKKPERLIKRIIEMFSKDEDVVLDFFGGSFTTAATSMKLNRKFISIEQMEYIKDISIQRLINVINGDSTGISKEVNWQGGGSFVYAELMEKNTGYLKDVLNAESMDRLKDVFNLMLDNADFDFRVDLEEVKDSLWRLSLEDQKRTLVKIIDKNQLYYNYSEIDDKNIRDFISESDYQFNKSFYEDEGVSDE